MEAHQLFRDAVYAIRQEKNLDHARNLLKKSLALEPHNAQAWLWLAYTLSDSHQQLQCIEYALQLDPNNPSAHKLKARLSMGIQAQTVLEMTQPEQQIKKLLRKAERALRGEDWEEALRNWFAVLDIAPDHEIALSKAVHHLWDNFYKKEAWSLLERALNTGTLLPSVYLLAINCAEHDSELRKADRLRLHLVRLSTIPEEIAVQIVAYFVRAFQYENALKAAEWALETYPENQELLILAGDIAQKLGQGLVATEYYDQAARVDVNSALGKAADKRLEDTLPILSEQERRSVLLAVREAFGVSLVFLLMAYQDAGLNVFALGMIHWLGVFLAFIGGYFLVTATSSPYQSLWVQWFVRSPNRFSVLSPPIRVILGVVGIALLTLAGYCVFAHSLKLLLNPIHPNDFPAWRS